MGLTKERLLAQVQQIRSEAAIFLSDTITLLRVTGDTVVNGESVPVYASPEVLNCRIINRSGDNRSSIAAQFRAVKQSFYDTNYRIQLPFGTQIKIGDRLVYNDGVEEIKLEAVFIPIQHDLMGAFVIGAEKVA